MFLALRNLLTSRLEIFLLVIAALVPAFDVLLPEALQLAASFRLILVFSLLGLGLNVVTGCTGLLNLGVAAFMAIGAYCYGILTCDIYPFQLGFWSAFFCTAALGLIAGTLLGLPALRLRGDYLALVTLGFGEITQDLLRNMETITKGTQGINPLPAPSVFIAQNQSGTLHSYYVVLVIVLIAFFLFRNIVHSPVGRSWLAVRDDELAASCMGVETAFVKLQSMAIGAMLCSISGALWAAQLGSTGEPGNYDFQLSILALCIVIVGGLGSIPGVLLGAFVMVGFNSILLVKLSEWLQSVGISDSQNVFTVPGNWKYFVFGIALILMMRFRPQGLLPVKSSEVG